MRTPVNDTNFRDLTLRDFEPQGQETLQDFAAGRGTNRVAGLAALVGVKAVAGINVRLAIARKNYAVHCGGIEDLEGQAFALTYW